MKPQVNWGKNVFAAASWAEQYEAEAMACALSQLFVAVSNMKQDTKEATDFVTQSGHYKWASRMRRVETAAGVCRDITIRYRLKSKAKTEIDKLQHVQLYLYAWIKNYCVEEYIVWDVQKAFAAKLFDGRREIWNRDGKSSFIAVPTDAIWYAGAIVAGHKYPDRSGMGRFSYKSPPAIGAKYGPIYCRACGALSYPPHVYYAQRLCKPCFLKPWEVPNC